MYTTVVLFLFATVFYTPLYRIAQSKGYPGATLVRWTVTYHAAVSLVLFVLGVAGITHWQLGLAYLPISLVLLVVQCLPERKGAPGRKWFTISMICKACEATIAFDRSREGLVDSCPRCGEILTVSEGASAIAIEDMSGVEEPEEIIEGTPGPHMVDDKWITLRAYQSGALADMDRQALEAAGVPAVLQSAGPAGVFPTSLGTILLVPSVEKAHAESVLFPRDEEALE